MPRSTRRKLTALGMAGLALVATAAQAAGAESQAVIFERFKALAGNYLGDEPPENRARVEYQLWSRDSVVMEIWNMPTKREFTVFHMDGDKLIATHYCGAKIQVTMDLQWPAKGGIYAFRARHVSNHAGPDAPYNSGFGYRFLENGDVWRNELWTTAGKTSESELMLIRQADSEEG